MAATSRLQCEATRSDSNAVKLAYGATLTARLVLCDADGRAVESNERVRCELRQNDEIAPVTPTPNGTLRVPMAKRRGTVQLHALIGDSDVRGSPLEVSTH